MGAGTANKYLTQSGFQSFINSSDQRRASDASNQAIVMNTLTGLRSTRGSAMGSALGVSDSSLYKPELTSPDLTDQLIRNVERAERMRLKTGTTRASLFAAPKDPLLASAAPQKIPAPPPPTKKR